MYIYATTRANLSGFKLVPTFCQIGRCWQQLTFYLIGQLSPLAYYSLQFDGKGRIKGKKKGGGCSFDIQSIFKCLRLFVECLMLS